MGVGGQPEPVPVKDDVVAEYLAEPAFESSGAVRFAELSPGPAEVLSPSRCRHQRACDAEQGTVG